MKNRGALSYDGEGGTAQGNFMQRKSTAGRAAGRWDGAQHRPFMEAGPHPLSGLEEEGELVAAERRLHKAAMALQDVGVESLISPEFQAENSKGDGLTAFCP